MEVGTGMLEHSVGLHDHTQGSAAARVTLVEYGDYQSAACGQAHAFVKQARLRLGDRMRFAFRHFAMTAVHANAQRAAEAAEAAGAQGRFWDMHDSLFTHQASLDNGHLVEYADTLGLDTQRFLRDVADHVYIDRISEDWQSGIRSGVDTTPAFFINGVHYEPAWQDSEALLSAIENATWAVNDEYKDDGEATD